MQQEFMAYHEDDLQGNPAGGRTVLVISKDIGGAPVVTQTLYWQNGPLKDARGEKMPPNGLFVETLIAAAADRVRYYQGKKFACEENADALAHLEAALKALQSRTARREKAGIEGTHGVQAGHEAVASV